jgi:DNA-binding transcriptional LysR family regulator
MREQGSGTRKVAEDYFAEHHFSPHVAMSLGSNEAIKHAVAAQLGIAVVSELVIAGERSDSNQGLTCLNVVDFPIQREWSVVWHRQRTQSAAAAQFVRYLQGQSIEIKPSGLSN